MLIEDRLFDYATERQKEILKAVQEAGSQREAARRMGVHHSTVEEAVSSVKRKSALQGYNPDDSVNHVSPPYVVRGKSTLYDRDNQPVMTWVKTRLDEDQARQAIEDWVTWLTQDARGLAEPVAPPAFTNDEVMAVYPMGDPHFGMYAWGQETGAPFDLDIAERLTKAAIDRLVASAPASHTALLLELGDFFHMDNSSNRTPQHGNTLDVDTRWQRVMQIGLRTMIYCIQRLLQKHTEVVVRIVQGNHDPHSSVALALALDAYFHNETRVKIAMSPQAFWYYRFGKVMIGATHGDTTKPVNLPGIMAADQPEMWGQTAYRYFYHGHIHHDSVKEFPGCLIESFRTLAARDAWHSMSGYRAGRDMKVIVMHREYGEVERHRVDVAAL